MLDHQEYDVSYISWLAVTAELLFVVCFIVGLSSVTYTLIAEIFPMDLKALGGAVFTFNSAVLSFILIKLFEVVSNSLGNFVPFFAFAIFTLVFIPFVWFCVPETKGKTLEAIQEELNK